MGGRRHILQFTDAELEREVHQDGPRADEAALELIGRKTAQEERDALFRDDVERQGFFTPDDALETAIDEPWWANP